MKKGFVTGLAVLLLAACANNSASSSNTQMYGEIKGGVETSKTF